MYPPATHFSKIPRPDKPASFILLKNLLGIQAALNGTEWDQWEIPKSIKDSLETDVR
jgi:hypothetical protein